MRMMPHGIWVLYQTATIGNRIWLDTNANGIQDAGELNITESITVELLNDANITLDTNIYNYRSI